MTPLKGGYPAGKAAGSEPEYVKLTVSVRNEFQKMLQGLFFILLR
jgi:hypothetical protein